MVLTKEQIVGADDRKFDTVNVPEWGGAVRLGSMSARSRLAHERFREQNENDGAIIVADLLVRCIVDDNGNCIFDENDRAVFVAKNPGTVLALFEKAVDLNFLGIDGAEEKRKNSEAGTSGDSPTPSPPALVT